MRVSLQLVGVSPCKLLAIWNIVLFCYPLAIDEVAVERTTVTEKPPTYFDEKVEIYSLLLKNFPYANFVKYVGQEADVKMIQ